MDIKKFIKDNITYQLINTKRFKQISIVVFLTKKFNVDDIPYSYLLINNLMYSSKKYNSKDLISSASEDLYGLKASSSFTINGTCESISFSLDFINPKYLDSAYLDDALDYFSEIIFNPNVNDFHFNEEYFNIIKSDTISSINALKDNPSQYAAINYASIMYKGTPEEYPTLPTLESLNKVNTSNLYTFYKEMLNNKYKVDIVVLGEVDESIIDKIHSRFRTIKSNNSKLGFMVDYDYDKKLITKIDALKYNQSKLYMGYRLNDFNYHELMHISRVYNTILGTMNDSILFNIVREENSLCYNIGSYINRLNPSLTIYAGINKNNYEKTIELIKKCVSDMSKKEVIERLFDSAKKTINTYLNNYYDDASAQINHYYMNEFEVLEDIEVLKENINKVTIDEVIELNKKISLSTIYMLKGDN